MSTEMVKAAPVAMLEFSDEQRRIIRNSFANGASDSEFAVLMEVARAKGLNPLKGQIHFVKRWTQDRGEVWATQTGIDGFRAIAERTGLYDGQDEPEYEYDKNDRLRLARVKVWRKDWSRPSVGVAHFSEYCQTKRDGKLTRMWDEKPHIMLAKCAEALGMRKAFPEPMSGLLVPEEMGEDGPAPTPPPKVVMDADLPQKISAPSETRAMPSAETKVVAAVLPSSAENMAETADQKAERLIEACKTLTVADKGAIRKEGTSLPKGPARDRFVAAYSEALKRIDAEQKAAADAEAPIK